MSPVGELARARAAAEQRMSGRADLGARVRRGRALVACRTFSRSAPLCGDRARVAGEPSLQLGRRCLRYLPACAKFESR